MAKTQKYGIKYPFTNENNENVYVDLNETYTDGIKSRVLHVLFTPKGQKIRDPEFGTNLIRYIFDPSDSSTIESLKAELKHDISAYVPEVQFEDISINNDENSDNGKIVIIHYTVIGSGEITSVAVKI